MNFTTAQKDMRTAYFGGAPGILVSGLIWLIAGISTFFTTEQMTLLIFFLGGMFIHPLGILVAKGLKRSGKHQKDNPLGILAMESTFLLFIGLFIAYCVFQIRSDWFFSIMLLIIGGRYVLFSSIYGMRIYWILGLVLSLGGAFCLLSNQPFYIGAFLGGIVEVVFSFVVFKLARS